MKTNILITKTAEEIPTLVQFCKDKSLNLYCHSFIDFNLVEAKFPQTFDWIFFGSKRAAFYYLKQAKIPQNCKIACIGEKTKENLEKMGISVDFFSTKSGNPEGVANELKSHIKTNFIIIPTSNLSKHSIAKVFPKNQVEEIVVYTTILRPKQIIEKLDYIIFTSPSNVDGFLLKNQLQPTTKIIAWGKTTANHLNAEGFEVYDVLQTSTEKEIIDKIKQF